LVGVYSTPYVIKYRNSTGESYDQKGTFGVQIYGKPQLWIKESVSQNHTAISPGATFAQIFNVTNVGEDRLRKVQLSITVFHPFAIANSSSNFFVGDLNPTESQSLRVQFRVDQNAVVGVYSLPFTIRYEDSTGLSYDHPGAFGVQIVGKPKLLVDDVRVDPPFLVPGQGGLMSVRLTNVGEDVATDISIRIFGRSELLGSSFAYIAELDGKKTQSVLFPVKIAGNLEPSTYLLNITCTYGDTANNTYNMSELYEFEVAPVIPFVPDVYLALAAGIVVLSLGGYFLYTWELKDTTTELNKSRVKHQRKNEPTSRKRRVLRALSVAILICLIAIPYIFLLVPYMVHANLDNAGIVMYSEETTLDSLPEGVQKLLRERGFNTPVVILVKHLKPEWITMVITSEKFPHGSFIEMSDYVVNWRVDWRDFSFVEQTFDRFAIAEVKQLDQFYSCIERMPLNQSGRILHELSRINFYASPILIVFCLTILLQRRFALWNLAAVLGLNSLQVFWLNAIATEHNVYVAPEADYFGYFFLVLIPLALYAWHFERSLGGRSIADKMRALSQALGLSRE